MLPSPIVRAHQPPATLQRVLSPQIKVFLVPEANEPYFAAERVSVMLGETDEIVLVKINGELVVMELDEYRQRAQKKGLHLVGRSSSEVELIGAVVFVFRCTSAKFCPSCRMCDSPLD